MSMCSNGAITWKRAPGPYLSTRSTVSGSAMPCSTMYMASR